MRGDEGSGACSAGKRDGFRGAVEQPAGTYGKVIRKTDAGC